MARAKAARGQECLPMLPASVRPIAWMTQPRVMPSWRIRCISCNCFHAIEGPERARFLIRKSCRIDSACSRIELGTPKAGIITVG